MTSVTSREGAESTVGASPSARGAQILRDLLPSWRVPRGTPARPRGWRRRPPVEAEVAALLAQLGDGWTVLRASDALAELGTDFLVVGPSGVFTITSARPTGGNVWVDEKVLWINGRPTDHVRVARRCADGAETIMSDLAGVPVAVTPVVALLDPVDLSFGGDPARRVRVLPADILVRSLVENAAVHSTQAVEYLSSVAEECSTWSATR
ncbi:hypothetical protein [Lacisediminihabitans profunda]|uniref:NERD domain-containing protein n=1 Tax=Lacisediminihabitans profunda TaxID=2594790 RepID=A0A5C8UV57_9MICO|nr:hypothetical protein [Lacisediminihabitans profunda]TXN31488.1 hypothetical protein FVP33_08085 [Lacisediminihabitans profunda]